MMIACCLLPIVRAALADQAAVALIGPRQVGKTTLALTLEKAHALLGLADHNALNGHPAIGASWEGLGIENLLAAVPERTLVSFYRTAVGAEIAAAENSESGTMGHRDQAGPVPEAGKRLPDRLR